MGDTVSTGQVGKVCPQCGTEYPFEQRFCPNDGTTLRAKNATGDLVGSIIADRYHVVKKLGEGGMGQVYLAEHVKMGRKSAVKVMNPGMTQDPDAISRFNREASNASRINHPNVAAIYDFGETPEGIIYLAMEFVEGDSLTSIIEKNGALAPQRAGDILRQAGEALAVAHDLGIVHRDLKPDNIMIARNREGTDVVKVVDFGIAKAGNNEAQKVTKTGLVVGTPEYMSPEQLAGDTLDGRSDIYSLGLVAFNMLTGKLPFPSETVQESMIMRLTDRPRTLSEMHPNVGWPQELQDVLDKALARSAKDRYQSASQFGNDFAAAVQGMEIAHPAEAGTQVLGAPVVPPTRVAPSSPPAGQGATVAQGAVAPPATAGKSRLPLFAGAGVAVAGIGLAAVLMLRPAATPAGPAVTGDTANPSTLSQGSTDSAPATKTATAPPAVKTDTQLLNRPAATRTPASSEARPQSFAAELRRIRRLTNDPDVAASAAPLVEQLLPRLVDPQEIFEARFLRAQAWFAADRRDESCAELRLLISQSLGMNIAEEVDRFTKAGCPR
jgi:eukaryotic-like serine/threonine-protein kinase